MTQRNIDRLLELMARLRDPTGGCPWDVAQDFASIAPYTIEEAYEVAEAIARRDMEALREELGDLLLQVVFHARMAEEAGEFDFEAVAAAISEKLIRRHPHVFADATERDAEGVHLAWEAHKAAERAAKSAKRQEAPSALDGVALALPALARAQKLQSRAARVGFDWTEAATILDKIEEEIAELREEMAAAERAPARIEDELGDLLFALVNLGRRLELDAEGALRHANAKFERRFRRVEALLAERGTTPSQSTLDEMDRLWGQAKREEKTSNR